MDAGTVLDNLQARIADVTAASHGQEGALVARFAEAARRVSATVHEVTDAARVATALTGIIQARGARLCQLVRDDLPLGIDWTRAVEAAGSCLSDDPSTLVEADLGLTAAVAGIAETGSLITHLDPVDHRLATMLPLAHVVLLPRDRIVASLEEGLLLTRYRILTAAVAGRPTYVSWVTGPSRTADIERTLAIGVHGPRTVDIILLPSTGTAGGSW